MSLKFGVYLVEQRIVTPEQFCGLIKIQQESTSALPTLALRKNLMTIRQVANVLETIAQSPGRDFQSVATGKGYLHAKEADYLVQIQQTTAEPIRALAVECGLLTERQAAVLFLHFQRVTTRTEAKARAQATAAPATPVAQPVPAAPAPAPTKTAPIKSGPRKPNFRRRPIIIERESSNV